MQIVVTGRHVEVPDDVRSYAEEKARKLRRFYNRIQAIEVVFDHESEQFRAEMLVRVDRQETFVASDSGADTFALIDIVVDKLERQLIKCKEKRRNHKHDGKVDELHGT
ncbi:MAG: ribosome hibernation-promoting factor, HPF/YfiA family [Phycisphaerae bacterium]